MPIVDSTSLIINTFGCGRINQQFSICRLDLAPLAKGSRKSVDLIVTENLVHPIQGHRLDLNSYPHLRSLLFSEDYSSNDSLPVDVILGADYYHDFVLSRCKKGARKEPIAVETVLGWTLHGPFMSRRRDGSLPVTNSVFFCEKSNLETLPSDDLSRLWEMEGVPVTKDLECGWVTPTLIDGRISTPLPWKSLERPVSNRVRVQARQRNTDDRLTIEQTATREQYFKDLENRNIIEVCPSESSGTDWYLPHHCVWKDKLRVVFNGSFGTPSLNDMLLTGPNLLNVIPICLTSYRLHSYPVTADIEKAFLQIEISESDRDYTRFLLAFVQKTIAFVEFHSD